MAKRKSCTKMFSTILLISTFICLASCEDIIDSLLSEPESCEDACKNTYPLHTYPKPEHLSGCLRGCRLFSIIDLVEEYSDIDVARNACVALCNDAYVADQEVIDSCAIGCSSQQSFFQPFRSMTDDLFKSDPFQMDTGFMYPFLYAHSFYSNMIDKVSDSVSFSWSFYTQPEDGKMLVIRSQPRFMFFSSGPDYKTQNSLETNLAMNENSATPDLKNSQQMIDLESGQPYRLGARGLEPVDMYADSEVPQDWLSCISSKTGLSKLFLCLTVFISCLGMIWLCLSTTVTAKEHRIVVQPQKLSIYGDLDYLKELQEKGLLKKLNPQDPLIQAGPLPMKLKVESI